jgi:hypothetical protein
MPGNGTDPFLFIVGRGLRCLPPIARSEVRR